MTEKTFGIRGFPKRCVCGGDVTIYTSKTQENLGRPFFRCVTKKEDHLFKWVEQGVYEEVLDALPKLLSIEAECEEMKATMDELRDEVKRSKNTIGICKTMMMICVGFLCIIIYKVRN